MRNCFMQLWRLHPWPRVDKVETPESWKCRSILSPKAWKPGEPVMSVIVQNPVGSRTKRTLCFSLSLKARKDQCLNSSQARGNPSYSAFFVLFRSSNHWMRLTHIREDKLLHSVYWFKYYLIQKYPHRPTQNDVFSKCLSGCSSVDHNVNHHSYIIFYKPTTSKLEMWVPKELIL